MVRQPAELALLSKCKGCVMCSLAETTQDFFWCNECVCFVNMPVFRRSSYMIKVGVASTVAS